MAAEIHFNQLLRRMLELRSVILENKRYILIPIGALVGYYTLRVPLKDASNRFFAWIYYKYCLEETNKALEGYRERMKADLGSQKEQVLQSRNDDALQILEIGMGPGANLDFFPESSRVIAVEPNPYFVNELNKLQKSQAKLVRVIHGFAEDLRDVSDESMDAVVSTLVMCSVNDLDKSIKEVKRVLVKGGRFYFFEHQACPRSWKRYLLQVTVNPLWSILFDGCRLSRQIFRQIEANGFDMTHASESELSRLWYINKATTHGYAIKH